jgi:hypothetical protein
MIFYRPIIKIKKKISFFSNPNEQIKSYPKNLLLEIQSFLIHSFKNKKFNSQNEKLKMISFDFLRDLALNKTQIEHSIKAKEIIENLRERIKIKKTFDKRQQKSLLGDKIDLMAIKTQIDQKMAFEDLLSHQNDPHFKYLIIGYLNGLYFLGFSLKNIKQQRIFLNNLIQMETNL